MLYYNKYNKERQNSIGNPGSRMQGSGFRANRGHSGFSTWECLWFRVSCRPFDFRGSLRFLNEVSHAI